MTTREKIQASIVVNELTGCWEWNRSRDKDGYGHVRVAGSVLQAHRALIEYMKGTSQRASQVEELEALYALPERHTDGR